MPCHSMLSEPLEVLSNVAELHFYVDVTAAGHSGFGQHVPHRLEHLDVVLFIVAIGDATRIVVHLSRPTHERRKWLT